MYSDLIVQMFNYTFLDKAGMIKIHSEFRMYKVCKGSDFHHRDFAAHVCKIPSRVDLT